MSELKVDTPILMWIERRDAEREPLLEGAGPREERREACICSQVDIEKLPRAGRGLWVERRELTHTIGEAV